MRLKLYVTLFTLVFVSACKSDVKNPKEPIKPKPVVKVSFDADSAYNFVAEQVAFGPRVPGTSAHQKTLVYLKEKLALYCDTAEILTGTHTLYDKTIVPIFNVWGRFDVDKTKRIMLAAHWDTRPQSDEDPTVTDKPADGANDGASGVGVLLEIARQLKTMSPEYGVDIIFFDNEDGGESGGRPDTWCLGSQNWGESVPNSGYTAQYGILLDMVGAKNATFAYEGYSTHFNQQLMLDVWKTGQNLGYGGYFLSIPGNTITDDHVYMNRFAGIPSIDIIHYDLKTNNRFPEHWHKQTDNMDIIDKNTLTAVGHTVLHVVANKR
ncbi:MAG: glutaminyl-peptide cyclotransferase [Bacteroidia bacterium]|jgi:glutaminyl-peptide cyclotransferase